MFTFEQKKNSSNLHACFDNKREKWIGLMSMNTHWMQCDGKKVFALFRFNNDATLQNQCKQKQQSKVGKGGFFVIHLWKHERELQMILIRILYYNFTIIRIENGAAIFLVIWKKKTTIRWMSEDNVTPCLNTYLSV